MTEQVSVSSCDVLVVGGGLAGCMAALRARIAGASVVLLEKSAVERSGSAASGLDHARGVYPVEGAGSLDDFAEAFLRQSEGMGNRKLLRLIGEEMPERMYFLESLGLRIRDDRGQLFVQSGVGTKQAFILSFQGEDLKKRLNIALRGRGVEIRNRTIPTRLLMSGASVVGATLLHTRSAEFSAIMAKAVVLASGGAVRLYPTITGRPFDTGACPYNTGDAYVLGLQAGAQMVNFEFTSVTPTLKSYSVPGYGGAIAVGARLVNASGQRFMERYDAQMLERAPRHIVTQAIYQEQVEGHGPCYLDFRHLPAEALEHYRDGLRNERALILRYFAKRGLDPARDLVEIELGEMFTHNGGVTGLLTDETAATNVPGLFAAGDCVGGIGYCAGSNALVFGWRAGGSAAKHAAGVDYVYWPVGDLADERDKVLGPLGRERGIKGLELEAAVRKTMGEYVGVRREDAGLRAGLQGLENLHNIVGDLRAETPLELLETIEAKAALVVGEMVGRAALERVESRWLHHRVDFPQKLDPEWRKFVMVTGRDSRIVLGTSELPT